MPEINSITIEQVKKFHLGTILNGEADFQIRIKIAALMTGKNLSKEYYDASTVVDGVTIPIFMGYRCCARP